MPLVYTNSADGCTVTLGETPSGHLVIEVKGCMARILTLEEADEMSRALDLWVDQQRGRTPNKRLLAHGSDERALRVIEHLAKAGHPVDGALVEKLQTLALGSDIDGPVPF